MNRLRKLLRRTAIVAGWILILCGSLLFVLERSGLLADSVNQSLSALIDEADGQLTVREVDLDWFEPALLLEGLRFEADGHPALEIERTRLVFAPWLGRSFGLERVEIDAADLHLSPSLSKRVKELIGRPSEDSEPKQARLPAIIVNELRVELDTEDWGNWPLGEIDLRYSAESGAPALLSGQLKAEAWWAGSDAQNIQLYGTEVSPGVLELHALARGLSIDLEDIPEGLPLEALLELQPSAQLDLQVEGRLYLDGSQPPTGSVRVALAEGEMRAPDVPEPVRELTLTLEAIFAPAEAETLFDFEAWDGRAVASANWREIPVAVTARVGRFARAEHDAEVWLNVPEVVAEEEYIEEIIALLRPIERTIKYVANDLGARGRGELTVAMALDRDWTPEQSVAEHLHQFVHVRADGGAQITYNGPANEDGDRVVGFPIPVRDLAGDFLYSRDPQRPQPGLMGLVQLEGNHGNGVVQCTGTLSSKHPLQIEEYPPLLMDLTIAADALAVGPQLHEATLGIRGVIPEEELWELYRPEKGAIDLDLRLVMEAGRRTLASHVGIDLREVGLQWAPIPVPLRRTRGLVNFDSDGRTGAVTSVRIAAELDTAEALDLVARLDSSRELGTRSHAEALVHKLSLKGDDVRILATHQPAVRSALDSFGPKGFADARCSWSSASKTGEATLVVDLAPRGPCEIDPEVFTMNTKDLRGRVIVSASLPAIESEEANSAREWQASVLAMPLVGTWGAGIDVALSGEFGDRAAGRLALHGAGIQSSNRRLLGSLAESLSTAGTSGTRLDLTSLTVNGRLDFGADLLFTTSEDKTLIDPDSEFLVFLRENDIVSARGFHLDRLDGRVLLNLQDGELEAEVLDAVLGSTPVRLSNPKLHRVDDILRLETGLDAQGLPLDREHLRLFMDEDTLAPLLDELQWRGTIDVHDAELVFDSRKDGTTRLTLRGPATLSDVFMQVGVPASIRSAQAYVNSLVFEGGKTRAWGRLSDLFGTVADRSLESAEMLISFVEPRVSIENVEGHFIDSEGRVFPLGAGSERGGAPGSSSGGSAFAMDLRAPFPFEAAFALENVDVDGLTQGLFAADIANKGRLAAEMRLTGNLEELLDIRGSGFLELTRGQLWSVPVVRTLFSQLGLDDTAVFDSMGIRFEISDGVILMKELEAHSPILKLVGSGTLDFDGRLRHDLEVNYSLVDKLGFLRSFFYSIQNSLLRIAIRGDMERPLVILKNFFSDWRGERETKALPLPDVSGLPRRF